MSDPVPTSPPAAAPDPARVRADLLAWYDGEARTLAWRTGPQARAAGERPDPYRVWLSEVMLQQTTTPHATPYFQAFTARWPTVEALAAAPDAEVMGAWAGLGYYARARNLLKAARVVAGEHGGAFPDTEAALRALPGFGPYTAAAVAAIAFDRAANVVDGNVERVVSRLWAVKTSLPAAKGELRRLAATLVAADRPGDWAQALMDLGATVCRPRSPLCGRCPVRGDCAAFATGAPGSFPRKSPRAVRERRYGAAYVATRGGEVALVRRPERGLLGGMPGLPGSAWTDAAPASGEGAPAAAEWRAAGEVEHVFTHFPLTLSVFRAEVGSGADVDGAEWTPVAEAERVLPTVFRKALAAALGRLV